MKVKDLFHQLEEWSFKKDAFSINDFLQGKGFSYKEFEQVAQNRKNL